MPLLRQEHSPSRPGGRKDSTRADRHCVDRQPCVRLVWGKGCVQFWCALQLGNQSRPPEMRNAQKVILLHVQIHVATKKTRP